MIRYPIFHHQEKVKTIPCIENSLEEKAPCGDGASPRLELRFVSGYRFSDTVSRSNQTPFRGCTSGITEPPESREVASIPQVRSIPRTTEKNIAAAKKTNTSRRLCILLTS